MTPPAMPPTIRNQCLWAALLALCWGVPPSSPASGAEPVAVELWPKAIRLADPSDRQQLLVTSRNADGSIRDLTSEAAYTVEPPGRVAVSKQGVARPIAPGAVTIRVSMGDAVAEARAIVEPAANTRPVSYRHDVSAVLSKGGCNAGACHGNLNGKGGFKLSLRGQDPDLDYDALTRDLFGRRIDRTTPEQSLILQKPTGRLPHEGGVRFASDSLEARILQAWIETGARDDRDRVPDLKRLLIQPNSRINAAPGRTQQLVVTAEFADDSTRDVTRLATYEVDDPTVVEVSSGGLVRRSKPGESVIVARYLNLQAVARVAFLPDRPDFAWDGPPPKTRLDEAVFEQLRDFKIHASPRSPDHVFIRRAYLDALGVLPTPKEVRAFLNSNEPDKRGRLIDELLSRPEFADHWSLKWADLLRNEEKTMGTKGVWAFRRWLRDQIAADRPMTEFAEALITGTGSTWLEPPASFYRTNRDPETCAETFGQVFLGVRLQCARCHNHPFDLWTQDDYYGLAAAFANIKRKEVNNQRRDRLNRHEINGDLVVFVSGAPTMRQPGSGERLGPTAPGGVTLEPTADGDARAALANWLTEGNRQFARNLANRVWFHLMGRGVVEPVDDFRASNPPSNPELLEALTDTFIAGGYRLKPLVRLIMTSEVYGLDSTPRPTNAEGERNFAKAQVRLLPAEVLLDALGSALDERPDLKGVPEGTRAVALAGANLGPEFLDAFGKPDRLLTCECERSEATTLGQAFQLINGALPRRMIEAPDNRIGQLLDSGADDETILTELYLAALCREPTEEERSGALRHVRDAQDRRRAWEDVAWAIVNSKEFLLRD